MVSIKSRPFVVLKLGIHFKLFGGRVWSLRLLMHERRASRRRIWVGRRRERMIRSGRVGGGYYGLGVELLKKGLVNVVLVGLTLTKMRSK